MGIFVTVRSMSTTPATPSPAPQLPAGPRTTELSIPLAWAVVIVAFFAAVVNGLSTALFPPNAPVEWIFAAGITIDLLVIALVLIIRALAHSKRLPAAPRPPKPSRTAIVGAVLGFIGLLVVVYSGIAYFGDMLAGERPRYMTATGGVFFFAAPWVLGVIFGVAAYRRGGGKLNAALSIGSIACGMIVVLLALTAAILYGMGATD